MNGFESYSPAAWIEQVFAVALPQRPERATRRTARSGRWTIAPAGRVALVIASAVVASAVSSLTAFTATNESAQVLRAVSVSFAGAFAPPGYVQAIASAMRSVASLPEPALNADPQFLFEFGVLGGVDFQRFVAGRHAGWGLDRQPIPSKGKPFARFYGQRRHCHVGAGYEWIPGADGMGYYLSRGREAFAIVLSQSCEIDKKGSKAPVLVAPVLPLAQTVPDVQVRQLIREGRRYAFFPLNELEGHIDESYVDLRAVSFFPRAVLDASDRIGSATDVGAGRLVAHLVGFLREFRSMT